jgi:protein N-terminal methyltransferase
MKNLFSMLIFMAALAILGAHGSQQQQCGDETCHSGDDEVNEWYQRQVAHWDTIAEKQDGSGLTYDAMVGGTFSEFDIRDSEQFLLKLMGKFSSTSGLVALDCAAGIGRVSRELLLHYFSEVDLLEPSQSLIDEARRHLLKQPTMDSKNKEHPLDHRAVNFFPVKFHEHRWNDFPHRYDVIWIQWALDKLLDSHAVEMLQSARSSLRTNESLLILKENICSVCTGEGGYPDGFQTDDEPTITRSLEYLKANIITPAEFEIVDLAVQMDLDPELYPIYLLALRPMDHSAASREDL